VIEETVTRGGTRDDNCWGNKGINRKNREIPLALKLIATEELPGKGKKNLSYWNIQPKPRYVVERWKSGKTGRWTVPLSGGGSGKKNRRRKKTPKY